MGPAATMEQWQSKGLGGTRRRGAGDHMGKGGLTGGARRWLEAGDEEITKYTEITL